LDRVNRRIDMQTCRDQHEAIRSLLDLFPEATPVEAKAVTDLIARLGRVLSRHLKLEDDFLYPALLASDDRTLRETALRYREEMGGLSRDFDALLAEWTTGNAIKQRPQEFLVSWLAFKRRLEVRMAKEDHGLYEIAEDYMKQDAGA
jgi:hypothetical protein